MPSPRSESAPRVFSLANSLGRAANAILPRRLRRHDIDDKPPSPSAPARLVTHIHLACRQLDADGLGIRRPSASIHPSAFSPFLLLDHCGPHRISPDQCASSEAPRCGQQALSYVVSGELQYHDSCANSYALQPGHAHLLTAGAGLVVNHRINSPVIEYFSIWINIPRDAKSAPPVQHLAPALPSITIGKRQAAARIRVLAAPPRAHPAADDEHPSSEPAPAELHTAAGRAAVYDVRMNRKSQLVLNPATQRVFVYVYRGTAVIAKKSRVGEGAMAVLEENADLPVVIDSLGVYEDARLSNDDGASFEVCHELGCWCLVLAGDPIMEPVSMLPSGIVACTPQQIRKAFQEYTCGSMGATSPSADGDFISRAALLIDDSSDDDNDATDIVYKSDESSGELAPNIGFAPLEI